jgi:hypothetical protein
MNKIIIILTLLFILSCSGFKYQIIENDHEYLLKGTHYNNNPFIKVKAVIPNSYAIEKMPSKIATKQSIESTELRSEEISEGYIVDRINEIEIRLIVYDRFTGKKKLAAENGIYPIRKRLKVEDVDEFISENERFIYEQMNP